MSTTPLPTPETRWRCTRCGNLTRFDVTRGSRAREFVHVDLAGEAVVEEREVLHEVIEHVRCRWCDALDSVELVPRPASAAGASAQLDGQITGSDGQITSSDPVVGPSL